MRRPAATAFMTVRQFRFGAAIQARDGAAGTLAAVVVDEARQAITQIGVRTSRFRRHLAFVPLDLVTAATDERVTLNRRLDELRHQTLPPPGIVLTGATHVDANGKPLGRLVRLTSDRETGVVLHWVVAQRFRQAVVPAHTVTHITTCQVSVTLDTASGHQRLPYRSDAELARRLHARLYDYQPLRIDLPGIEILPVDGRLWLRGHVSSGLQRRLAEEMLHDEAGVSVLTNALVADTDLAATVSMALAHDPRTAGQHIGVYPRLGAVHLRGDVASRASRDRASEVAGAVPAVTQVLNDLRVDPSAAVVPMLAGVTADDELVPGGR
jgi:osmotically-inducible protein OsmY